MENAQRMAREAMKEMPADLMPASSSGASEMIEKMKEEQRKNFKPQELPYKAEKVNSPILEATDKAGKERPTVNSSPPLTPYDRNESQTTKRIDEIIKESSPLPSPQTPAQTKVKGSEQSR